MIYTSDTCILYKKVEQCRVRRGAALLHTAVSSNSELTYFHIIDEGPQNIICFSELLILKMALFSKLMTDNDLCSAAG